MSRHSAQVSGTAFAIFLSSHDVSRTPPRLKLERGLATSGSKSPHSPVKDPTKWTGGDEPMTGAQASYLRALAREAGEPLNGNMTKAEASQKIDELRQKVGLKAKPRRAQTI
jgi:Protein of unknown function (DUF3072)